MAAATETMPAGDDGCGVVGGTEPGALWASAKERAESSSAEAFCSSADPSEGAPPADASAVVVAAEAPDTRMTIVPSAVMPRSVVARTAWSTNASARASPTVASPRAAAPRAVVVTGARCSASTLTSPEARSVGPVPIRARVTTFETLMAVAPATVTPPPVAPPSATVSTAEVESAVTASD